MEQTSVFELENMKALDEGATINRTLIIHANELNEEDYKEVTQSALEINLKWKKNKSNYGFYVIVVNGSSNINHKLFSYAKIKKKRKEESATYDCWILSGDNETDPKSTKVYHNVEISNKLMQNNEYNTQNLRIINADYNLTGKVDKDEAEKILTEKFPSIHKIFLFKNCLV